MDIHISFKGYYFMFTEKFYKILDHPLKIVKHNLQAAMVMAAAGSFPFRYRLSEY